MVTVCINERCLALKNGIVYEHATVLKVNKTTARVRYPTGDEKTIPLSHLWKQKKKKSVRTSQFCKAKGDKYIPRSRSQRFALNRRLAVKPVCFGHGFMGGDFHRILTADSARKESLCIFNDNTSQWEYHGAHPTEPQYAGGGNACARPWQHLEDAIGMPTGPFASLGETHHVSFAGEEKTIHTAKEIIDEAINRIVRLLVKHPEKETIFYSVDTPTSNKIGLAIFRGAVGLDVVDYITAKITALPRLVRLARYAA